MVEYRSNPPALNSCDENGLVLSPVWKTYLYQLQQQAPNPVAVCPAVPVEESQKPSYLGIEYHGQLSHSETVNLLLSEGQYLVRESGKNRVHHTLSLRFNNEIKHYRLYYDGQFYVGEKKFDQVEDLVADGLITMYLELKAGDYIHLMCRSARYEESPYFTLNERKRRTLSLSRQRHLLVANTISNEPYEKVHNFRVQNFKGLHWCDFCGNFMWGLIAQGVRCDDCGFVAHKKCSEKVPSDCCPDLKLLRGVFGVDLTTVTKAHGTRLPFVVEKCIKEIEARGLDSEGIYRVSGLREEVEALRLAFDQDGDKTDLSSKVWDDINVVAGVLKLYFRLLPIPLIAFQSYPAIVAAAKEPDEKKKIERIRDAIKLLPPAHYNTLRYLVHHLHRVSEHKEQNKMSSLNLSTVLCPTLFPAPDLQEMGNSCSIPDLHLEATSLNLIIQQPQLIFPS